jgi:hypothetical protein
MLEQFNGAGTLVRVTIEALHQEVNALLTKLVLGGELWRVTLSNVVHDSPLVVHGRPRATTSGHFENDATERPDVDGTVAAGTTTLDHLGGHVHGCSGHGALLFTASSVVDSEGPTLACDEFSGAKINELDYTVMVEEDICKS